MMGNTIHRIKAMENPFVKILPSVDQVLYKSFICPKVSSRIPSLSFDYVLKILSIQFNRGEFCLK